MALLMTWTSVSRADCTDVPPHSMFAGGAGVLTDSPELLCYSSVCMSVLHYSPRVAEQAAQLLLPLMQQLTQLALQAILSWGKLQDLRLFHAAALASLHPCLLQHLLLITW